MAIQLAALLLLVLPPDAVLVERAAADRDGRDLALVLDAEPVVRLVAGEGLGSANLLGLGRPLAVLGRRDLHLVALLLVDGGALGGRLAHDGALDATGHGGESDGGDDGQDDDDAEENAELTHVCAPPGSDEPGRWCGYERGTTWRDTAS